MSKLTEEMKRYLDQCAPHIRKREAAQIIERAYAALKQSITLEEARVLAVEALNTLSPMSSTHAFHGEMNAYNVALDDAEEAINKALTGE